MARPPVGYRLRQRRRESGITQAALAGRVGISASYLNLIEYGRRDVAGALLPHLILEHGLSEDDATTQAMRIGLRSADLLEWGLDYARRKSLRATE